MGEVPERESGNASFPEDGAGNWETIEYIDQSKSSYFVSKQNCHVRRRLIGFKQQIKKKNDD